MLSMLSQRRDEKLLFLLGDLVQRAITLRAPLGLARVLWQDGLRRHCEGGNEMQSSLVLYKGYMQQGE
jgi:hypothetical protein